MVTANVLGFAGIGVMGWPMASNLAKAGYPLHGYDPDATIWECAQSSRDRFDRRVGVGRVVAAVGEVIGPLAFSSIDATLAVFQHAGLMTRRHSYEDVIAQPPV